MSELGGKNGPGQRAEFCSGCALERSRIPVLRFSAADEYAFGLLAEVSSDRVFDPEAIARLARRVRRDPESGCLVWHGGKYAKGQYGAVQFKGMKWRAHRLSWVAHRGPIAKGLLVCHACDNPACIAIGHLFLGTPKDNMTDMRSKGRARWRAKLRIEQVARIKRRLGEGATMAEAAREEGVRYATVFAIRKGRIWKDVAAEQPSN